MTEPKKNFTIAFGSCNNQLLVNKLWDPISLNDPDVFIWAGDIIYADTYNIDFLKENYALLKNNEAYKNFASKTEILGVWDDHDYGKNDGGLEYEMKSASQQAFLSFLDVSMNDERRKRDGIYNSETYTIADFKIKIILLDTRYFRTQLTRDTLSSKRYQPNKYGEGSMLGEIQWNWLQQELESSTADFNILVSSIQLLSSEHGYETWGNMPHEIDRLEKLLIASKAKNVIVLSGDRHISEFSKKTINGLDYPLIDFTSSGMTHSYSDFKQELNPYRIGDVVSDKSFGLLIFNFDNQEVTMEIRGEKNGLLEGITQKYE